MNQTGNVPPELSSILLDEQALQKRIAEMADELNHDYANDELVMICVLKGAFMFLADLSKHLNFRVAQDFISISSYGEATKSSGVVKMVKDMEESIRNRHVLIVEDIVDTGLTLDYLRRSLLMREPKSLKICSCSLNLHAAKSISTSTISASLSMITLWWDTVSTTFPSIGASPILGSSIPLALMNKESSNL